MSEHTVEIDAPECKAVRPGTLGYQRCWREPGHAGPHKSQDRQEWDAVTPAEAAHRRAIGQSYADEIESQDSSVISPGVDPS